MSAPSLCPRCGNKKFRSPSSYGEMESYLPPEARRIDLAWSQQALLFHICTTCELAFTGWEWREPSGVEWTMAESGT